MTNAAPTKVKVNRFSATMATIHHFCARFRTGDHWNRRSISLGTLMRYFFFGGWCGARWCCGARSGAGAGTVASLALSCLSLAVGRIAIDLIGATDRALALLLGAAIKAVDVAEITGAAKHHQLTAAGATVEASGVSHNTASEPKQWTVRASTTILSPPTVQHVGIAAPG